MAAAVSCSAKAAQSTTLTAASVRLGTCTPSGGFWRQPVGLGGRRHSCRRPAAGAASAQAAATAAGPLQQPQGHQQQPASNGSSGFEGQACEVPGGGSYGAWRPYPHVEQQFPGLERLHDEPPVYIARGFLSAEDCQLLKGSAAAGELRHLHSGSTPLGPVGRLWPLLLVAVTAGVGVDAWHLLMSGDATADAAAGAAAAATAAGSSSAGVLAPAPPTLVQLATAVGGLLALLLMGVQSFEDSQPFTGTKWTAADVSPSHPAASALSRFLSRTCQLLGTQPCQLEPPTVTRFQAGQYQRIHFDARPQGDPQADRQFLEAGGQHLVQLIVYLNSLDKVQGGGTHFLHPLLEGLTVQPRQGDALIFFPAFADGHFDERMAHSALPVVSGEKWVLNTCSCQRPVPSALQALPTPISRSTAEDAN